MWFSEKLRVILNSMVFLIKYSLRIWIGGRRRWGQLTIRLILMIMNVLRFSLNDYFLELWSTEWKMETYQLFTVFSDIFWCDAICGHSLVGSNPRGPPVFQALSPCQISNQYLFRFSSSGSDTTEKLKFWLKFRGKLVIFYSVTWSKKPQAKKDPI